MHRRNFIKKAIFLSFFIKTSIWGQDDSLSGYNYNGFWPYKEFNQIFGGIKSNNHYYIRFSIDEKVNTPEKINEFNHAAINDGKRSFDYYIRSFMNENMKSISKHNHSKSIIYKYYSDNIKLFEKFIETNGFDKINSLNSIELNELFSNFQNSIEWRKINKDLTNKILNGASIVYFKETDNNKSDYSNIPFYFENIENIHYNYINIVIGKYSISVKKRLAFLKAKVNINTNEMSFDTSLIFRLLDEKIST